MREQEKRVEFAWIDWRALAPRGWEETLPLALAVHFFVGLLMNAEYGMLNEVIVWSRLLLGILAYIYFMYFFLFVVYNFVVCELNSNSNNERLGFLAAFGIIAGVPAFLCFLFPMFAFFVSGLFNNTVGLLLYR